MMVVSVAFDWQFLLPQMLLLVDVNMNNVDVLGHFARLPADCLTAVEPFGCCA